MMLIIRVQFCSFVDSLQVGHLAWFLFRYPESREYDAVVGAVVAKKERTEMDMSVCCVLEYLLD